MTLVKRRELKIQCQNMQMLQSLEGTNGTFLLVTALAEHSAECLHCLLPGEDEQKVFV